MKRLGIDIGSLYLGSALLEDGQIRATQYRDHKGNIAKEIEALLKEPQYRSYDIIGVTGSHEPGILDNTLAVIEGTKFLLPKCRNVFVIGGQTFSLLFFDEEGNYREHSINSPCAAGTGSFIEQQAKRLNISVPELARRASCYTGKTPVIATRCAVFAKTDIIHAMQEGYSLDAICAGFCEGITRNILDTLVKGRKIMPPVAVLGGVSLNPKIVSCMRKILGCEAMVPQYSEVVGSIGAALLGNSPSFDFDVFLHQKPLQRQVRPPLTLKLSHYPDFHAFDIHNDGDVEVFLPKENANLQEGVFIGFDIGSTSTKAIVMSDKKEIAGGFYTATKGEPIAAVKKLIACVHSNMDDTKLRIKGVGTTGSGRKMIKDVFNADMEINEITAHAKAAMHLYNEVDTIIEIGGQDSKFTRIHGGEVYYSTMNYVCAAGTGSFIEEQAKRLGMSLDDFSQIAMNAQSPYTSDRCTVYMERDLGVLLGQGWSKEALAAAVLNSIRDNFLAKVVNRSQIGDFIVFQGATGRNAALVAAFENFLQKPIHVSPYCHLTGALGVALLCRESGISSSRFLWDLKGIALEEEICKLCNNNCLLTIINRGDIKTGWGMKCGREYTSEHVKKPTASAPQKRFEEFMEPLFTLQEPLLALQELLLATRKMVLSRKQITIGLPNVLYNAEYLPLWYHFLSRLGFTVLVINPSRKALREGKTIVNSDFCAPMVLAHGCMKEMLEEKTDYIFYPSLVNAKDPDGTGELLFTKKTKDSYFCYYSQYLPTLLCQLTSVDMRPRLISPLIFFHQKSIAQIAGDIYEEMKSSFPGLGLEEVKTALENSWEKFVQAQKNWEKSYDRLSRISGKKMRIALLGRPYLVFDPVLNLHIPQKLEELGAEIFWQDEFALDQYELTYSNQFYERMHWQYGKKIIKLAEYCARSEDLFAVYLTCFRCSPDSFLISYVKDIMAHYDKPFLILQMDEHGSDVGYTTRIEAGIRSFRNSLHKEKPVFPSSSITHARNDKLSKGDTVLVSHLDEVISQFWVDSFTRAGYRAILLDADEKSLGTGYKYASGGECMSLVSIIGSVVEKVKSENLDPEKLFFYMPTACMACNFPQFPIFADLAFRCAGLNGLKIGLINSIAPGEVLPMSLSLKILESNIVGCVLYKLYNRIKPYETEKGSTDKAFNLARKKISEGISSGKSFQASLTEAISYFKTVARDESRGRNPKIGLLGDLYVKYNEAVNQKIQSLVEELGGELIIPSITEYAAHFFDADIRIHGGDPRPYEMMRRIERKYEKLAEELIGDELEPDIAECAEMMARYGIKHYIAGETTINVGKALYYIEKKIVNAIIHINPMFCCPGVVTASIYRKIQEDFHIPIIDIFYDGTGNPNRVLIPYIHYMKKNK